MCLAYVSISSVSLADMPPVSLNGSQGVLIVGGRKGRALVVCVYTLADILMGLREGQ